MKWLLGDGKESLRAFKVRIFFIWWAGSQSLIWSGAIGIKDLESNKSGLKYIPL